MANKVQYSSISSPRKMVVQLSHLRVHDNHQNRIKSLINSGLDRKKGENAQKIIKTFVKLKSPSIIITYTLKITVLILSKEDKKKLD